MFSIEKPSLLCGGKKKHIRKMQQVALHRMKWGCFMRLRAGLWIAERQLPVALMQGQAGCHSNKEKTNPQCWIESNSVYLRRWRRPDLGRFFSFEKVKKSSVPFSSTNVKPCFLLTCTCHSVNTSHAHASRVLATGCHSEPLISVT